MSKTYKVCVPQFAPEEYLQWKAAMITHLGGLELDGVVTGEDVKPTSNAEEWIKKDKQAKSLIFQGLEMRYVKEVVTCISAKEVWDKLQTLYGQSTEPCLTHLLKKFFDLKMCEGQSIKDFVTNVEFVAHQLDSAGSKLKEEFVIDFHRLT